MQVCPNCGHHNRPGIMFCENCGTSLIGSAAVGSTKSIEDYAAQTINQIANAGAEIFVPNGKIKLEIEGSETPIVLAAKEELIFGRRDPATGTAPDIDLTPYAGYRMGVSRRHAAIRTSEEQFLDLWDLGSSNGTFLDGQRLNAHRPYRIRDGSKIRLGQMVISVIFQPPDSTPKSKSEILAEKVEALKAAKAVSAEAAPATMGVDEDKVASAHDLQNLMVAAEATILTSEPEADEEATLDTESVSDDGENAADEQAVVEPEAEAKASEPAVVAPEPEAKADEPAVAIEDSAEAVVKPEQAAETPAEPAVEAAEDDVVKTTAKKTPESEETADDKAEPEAAPPPEKPEA